MNLSLRCDANVRRLSRDARGPGIQGPCFDGHAAGPTIAERVVPRSEECAALEQRGILEAQGKSQPVAGCRDASSYRSRGARKFFSVL